MRLLNHLKTMGNYNNHTIEEIEAGDLVYFDDTLKQSNYDEYWKVISKNNSTGEVQVHLHYLFEDHYLTLHYSDIRQRLPLRNLKRA